MTFSNKPKHNPTRLFLLSAVMLALAACGGTSDSDTDPTPEPTPIPDPLVGYQWYLHNQGQDVLAGYTPEAGVDLNMADLFETGVRGKGVTVMVVDSGLDTSHEDLKNNADTANSINFHDCPNLADLNTCPSAPLLDRRYPDNAHGTSVAGLIGMQALNGLGGRGIAPEVTLRSTNLLNEGDDDAGPGLSDQDELRFNLFALGDGNQRANGVDIFNMSYGEEGRSFPDEDDIKILLPAYEKVMRSTRQGKGAIYVKSAGNAFAYSEDFPSTACSDAIDRNIGCFDSATDPEASLSGTVLTAAVNASGLRSSYSSEGASIWVSGFGGEYNYHPDYSADQDDVTYQPALLSTDWSGCDVGDHNNDADPLNAINTPGSTIDPECAYTATFNGTSAAAPTVSAVAALVLQVRPDLTARDVHAILALSARNPGNWQQPANMLPHPIRTGDLGRELDQGWHTNDIGLSFSRWYGYGLVDAQTAVQLARQFPLLPDAQIAEAESDDDDTVPILYAGDQAVNDHESHLAVNITQDLIIERVQIAFETTHQYPANLLVTLVSPSGTRIPALMPYTSLEPVGSFDVGLMAVNGFLGEPAQGEWRLYIEDISRPYADNEFLADPPVIEDFAIRIIGHTPQAQSVL